MSPLGRRDVRTTARFSAQYANLRMGDLTDFADLDGLRIAGTASGRLNLQWPLGRFAQRRIDGDLHVMPPDDIELMTRRVPVELIEAGRLPRGPAAELGPRIPLALGADVSFSSSGTGLMLGPTTVRTPRTYVELEGNMTTSGRDVRLPFFVASADWQESYRSSRCDDDRFRRRERRCRTSTATARSKGSCWTTSRSRASKGPLPASTCAPSTSTGAPRAAAPSSRTATPTSGDDRSPAGVDDRRGRPFLTGISAQGRRRGSQRARGRLKTEAVHRFEARVLTLFNIQWTGCCRASSTSSATPHALSDTARWQVDEATRMGETFQTATAFGGD